MKNSNLLSIFLFVFAYFLWAAVGCKVTFVPGKSQAQIDLLTKIQSDANTIFTNSDLSYAGNEPAIFNVNNEIDSLIVFDQKRKKTVIVNQDLAIQTIFNEDATEWQTKGNISVNDANTYRSYFKSIVDPRLISEQSLK